MDPYSSPYIIPNNSPYNPFPHSFLSTREIIMGLALYERALGLVSGIFLEHDASDHGRLPVYDFL